MFCGAIRDLKLDDDLELKEEKTGKLRRVTLNKACISALQALLASNNKAPPHKIYSLWAPRGDLGLLGDILRVG
jgi:hypothetical protein